MAAVESTRDKPWHERFLSAHGYGFFIFYIPENANPLHDFGGIRLISNTAFPSHFSTVKDIPAKRCIAFIQKIANLALEQAVEKENLDSESLETLKIKMKWLIVECSARNLWRMYKTYDEFFDRWNNPEKNPPRRWFYKDDVMPLLLDREAIASILEHENKEDLSKTDFDAVLNSATAHAKILDPALYRLPIKKSLTQLFPLVCDLKHPDNPFSHEIPPDPEPDVFQVVREHWRELRNPNRASM